MENVVILVARKLLLYLQKTKSLNAAYVKLKKCVHCIIYVTILYVLHILPLNELILPHV